MNTRTEYDMLGDMEIPADAWYGIQTQRAVENFSITGVAISHFPPLINALAMVKWAAASTNREQCARHLDNSIGIITALVPHIGYANASRIASTALNSGVTVRELVITEGLLESAQLDQLLSPQSMLAPGASVV